MATFNRASIATIVATLFAFAFVAISGSTASARPTGTTPPSTWRAQHCQRHVVNTQPSATSHSTVMHKSKHAWKVRRAGERMFIRCAYGKSATFAKKAVKALHHRTIPTITDYRMYRVAVPGEHLPKTRGKPGSGVHHSGGCSKCLKTDEATTTEKVHRGKSCQHSYDHDSPDWWNEEVIACLHFTGHQVWGANSYFSYARGFEAVYFSSWGFADRDQGDSVKPWLTHGQTYGSYPWIQYNVIHEFDTFIGIEKFGVKFGWNPKWYVCAHPYVYANGNTGNNGITCSGR